jgi:hypothetical protein
MTTPDPGDAGGTVAAINAFLRGVERRGAVFAELLCGDALAGDTALAATLRAFQAGAARAPSREWSHRFWSLLLSTPLLRRAPPLPLRADALAPLARAGRGPRAALLLRLAAGLGETEAAAALGIAPATYRLALWRALPHRADGSADAPAWRALATAVQAAVKALPPQRLAHLAKLREAALLPAPPQRVITPSPPPSAGHVRGSRRRWLPALLWTGLAACVAALATSFLWPPPHQRAPAALPEIRVVPLPAAEAPAARFDADTALLSDRDFDLLLDLQDEPIYRDLDFYAWYVAQPSASATNQPAPGPAASAATQSDGNDEAGKDEPETSDATL